jgi:hypothetical protein
MTGQMLVIAVTDALAGRVQRRLHTRNQSANMPLAVTRTDFSMAFDEGHTETKKEKENGKKLFRQTGADYSFAQTPYS